jgi:hypothetical protein
MLFICSGLACVALTLIVFSDNSPLSRLRIALVIALTIGLKLAEPFFGWRDDRRGSGPPCPECGQELELRTYRSGPRVGANYYGCLPCQKGWPEKDFKQDGAGMPG